MRTFALPFALLSGCTGSQFDLGAPFEPPMCVLSLLEEDEHVDGLIDDRTEYGYDVLGNRVFEARDRDANGTLDSTERGLFAFDRPLIWEEDNDGDGVFEQREVWSYASGLVVQTEFIYESHTRRTQMAYDDARRLVWESLDNEGDGTLDQVVKYQYVDDQLDRKWIDQRGENGFDHYQQYGWDAEGRLAFMESGAATGPFDRLSYSYDAAGNLVRMEQGLGSVPVAVVRYTWNAGRLMKTAYDDDNDGSDDRWVQYTYDDDGNVLTKDSVDGRGTFIAYTYDGRGNEVERRIDDKRDHDWDVIEYRTWNCP